VVKISVAVITSMEQPEIVVGAVGAEGVLSFQCVR
jgi:hypothetical protein